MARDLRVGGLGGLNLNKNTELNAAKTGCVQLQGPEGAPVLPSYALEEGFALARKTAPHATAAAASRSMPPKAAAANDFPVRHWSRAGACEPPVGEGPRNGRHVLSHVGWGMPLEHVEHARVL